MPSRYGEASEQIRAVGSRLAAVVRRRFEIDARALAAFRIALGALVVADLALRARNLVAFYTDRGVLPRAALFADYDGVYSVHAMWGDAWVQAILFGLAGAVGVALLVGYRTRLATVLSWLFLVSLHARNPMVLNGGDVLFRMLLFWGMFLPLGERWSLDATRSDGLRSRIASVATAALLGQMTILYVTNAVHKTGGRQWLNGEAVVYVFSLDQFTVLLGNVLAEFHGLLRVFTYVWISLVVLSPLLVLSAGKVRTVLAALLSAMHLGMLATMQLGVFPLVAVAGLVVFYPAWVWDGIERRATRAGLRQRLRKAGTGWQRMGSRVPASPPSPPASDAFSRARGVAASAVVVVFVALVVLSNAQAVGDADVPEDAEQVLEVTQTDQYWRMFAPDPLGTDGWYVVPGTLENGTDVDVLYESRVTWERPTNVDRTYPTARWRKYLRNVWSGSNRAHRSYFAEYLCQRWNRTHETDVERVRLYYMAQDSQPYNATEPIERHALHDHDCSGPLRQ
jgi:hypothetical protein